MKQQVIYVLKGLGGITASELDAAIASLPEWRREQALKFKHEQGRKECAFSYLLLCRALREQFGVEEQPEFEYGEHGKPRLKLAPALPETLGEIHFNYSHCKEAIACAVSNDEVGVDIEMRGRYKETLARHCMNEAEMEQILASEDKDDTFTRLWTMKEAALKLTGEGIANNIKDVLTKNQCFTQFFAEKSINYVLSVAFKEEKCLKILFVNK